MYCTFYDVTVFVEAPQDNGIKPSFVSAQLSFKCLL